MKIYSKREVCPELETVESGEYLTYPIKQHMGREAKVIVSTGEYVYCGQLLAKGDISYISANIHASVSGTVSDIKPMLTAEGRRETSIIVKNDGRYRRFSGRESGWLCTNSDRMSSENIIHAVYDAGIVGMGGAGFPTHIKLSADRDAIRHVIINGAECEPYVTADYRLMLWEPRRLAGGIRMLLKLFRNARATVVIEDNKADAAKIIAENIKDYDNIAVKVIKSGYPKGAERLLVHAVTNKRLAMGRLPAEEGCIVCNVATVAAIYDAVIKGEPLIRRIVTVTGGAVAKPHNYLVRLGTDIGTLIRAARANQNDIAKIVLGGPMMGKAVYSYDIPVTKIVSAVICMDERSAYMLPEAVCIRCGRCGDVCPGRLVPQILAEYAGNYQWEQFRKAGGMSCCECGSCTYICPAKRSLTQMFAAAKKMVRSKGA